MKKAIINLLLDLCIRFEMCLIKKSGKIKKTKYNLKEFKKNPRHTIINW